jgi:hypothetical protein
MMPILSVEPRFAKEDERRATQFIGDMHALPAESAFVGFVQEHTTGMDSEHSVERSL